MTDSCHRPPRVVSQVIGRWDSYQILAAFHQIGCLAGFSTDFWWTRSPRRDRLCSLLPGRLRAALHRSASSEVPGSLAHIDPVSFGCMLLLRGVCRDRRLRDRLYRVQAQAIGEATRRLSERLKVDRVFSYSYYAGWTFPGLSTNTRCLLHQVHPYAPTLRTIYEREVKTGQLLSEQLHSELEMSDDAPLTAGLTDGPRSAHRIFAASTFTKESLAAGGIDPARVDVIPYGADLDRFTPGPGAPPGRPRVLFVGTVCARKGIGYLLQAWKALNPQRAELVIAGQVPDERRLREQLRLPGLTVLGRVSPAHLVELYQTSSVFCLPSLVEGFGLVYLQSLACGTPIIGTEATGAADILSDHPQVGFLAKSASVESLAVALESSLSSGSRLARRRTDAVRVAAQYTWQRFRERVAEWYQQATIAEGARME